MTHTIDNIEVEGLLDHKSLRFNGSFQSTANSTLSLTSTSEYLVAFIGSTVGQIIKLPNATTLTVGRTFQIWNNSSIIIEIQDGNSVVLFQLNPNQRASFILRDNSTTAGIWLREITSGSLFGGLAIVNCSYTASANVGRYLEFYPSNSSDLGPFLLITNATLLAISVVANASTTGTVSIYKTTDLVNSIASISLTSQTTNSITTLNIQLTAGDKLAARVTSGSILKPGVSLYIAGA